MDTDRYDAWATPDDGNLDGGEPDDPWSIALGDTDAATTAGGRQTSQLPMSQTGAMPGNCQMIGW